ncbi:hypothetical protein D3C78_1605870 [compost metagenome]
MKFNSKHRETLNKKWAIHQQLFEIIHKDLMKDPKAHIPQKTFYCYKDEHQCPFWSREYNYPHQENGYCYFLKQGDWNSEGFSLLWDMVKECGISDYIESDKES